MIGVADVTQNGTGQRKLTQTDGKSDSTCEFAYDVRMYRLKKDHLYLFIFLAALGDI